MFAAPGTRTTGNRDRRLRHRRHELARRVSCGRPRRSPLPPTGSGLGRRSPTARPPGEVHAFTQYGMVPLWAWGRDFAPPARLQVEPGFQHRGPAGRSGGPDGRRQFSLPARLMGPNRPLAEDDPILIRLRESACAGPTVRRRCLTSGLKAARAPPRRGPGTSCFGREVAFGGRTHAGAGGSDSPIGPYGTEYLHGRWSRRSVSAPTPWRTPFIRHPCRRRRRQALG